MVSVEVFWYSLNETGKTYINIYFIRKMTYLFSVRKHILVLSILVERLIWSRILELLLQFTVRHESKMAAGCIS